jgi:hypothetical protein
MSWWRFPLVLATLGALALPAPAGILFGKKNKPNPAERVPELILTIKTDKDESKRAAAAEELRQYDPASHQEIVPVLIDVLMNDPKPSVRSEAADSLGRIRPVSQEAGWALEQAMEKDGSMRVRLRARYSLLGYRWNGYESPEENQPQPSKEPPLAPPMGSPAPMTTRGPAVPPQQPAAAARPPVSAPPVLRTRGRTQPAANETAPPPLAPLPAGPGPELTPPPG